jgi:hypothetical protein
VPRGAEEGATLELDREGLQLVANKPVAFRLFSSTTRVDDQPGAVIELPEGDEVHQHAPLTAVIRFGKPSGERLVPVKLGAHLTAIGTLELWADSKISEHRWRLQFALRKAAAATAAVKPAAVVSEENLSAAEALIAGCFSGDEVAPEELPAKLEQALALGRNAWPLGAIRRLADRFLELADGRRRSAAHELRWLNLCGFCLRPGFGDPGDELRIEQARRVYAAGLVFANQAQNEIDWWIFCGRVAGGLNKNQQTDIYQRLSASLLPRGKGKDAKPKRLNPSLMREMWRCASSLELLPVGTKTELGEALTKRVKAGDAGPSEYWCLSRLGARRLLYGPANLVVPAAAAARWSEALLPVVAAGEAVAALASVTGDGARDLAPATLELVRTTFAKRDKAEELLAALEGESPRDLASLGRVFGEELPSGLVIQ